jgi:Tol biopolymer transport system component
VLTGCGEVVPNPGDPDARRFQDSCSCADAFLGQFSTPIAVTELNDPSQSEDDPTLTGDMWEIYFDSSRDGGPGSGLGDIWVARRTSLDEPFGAPTLIVELASTADDTTPDITDDGLTMYFASDRLAPGNRDLFVTTRSDRVSPWSAPTPITELMSAGDDSGAIEYGNSMVFASSRNGSQDLFLTTRTSATAPWGEPAPIPGGSDPTYAESQHWVNNAATVVFFTSDRPPSDGEDIWFATGASSGNGFGPATLVTELNGPLIDADPWLSPDLRTIYFTSQRSGSGDIYMATR